MTLLERELAKKLADREATIARVREVCDLWQRRYDSSIRHPADIASIPIEQVFSALDGADDE